MLTVAIATTSYNNQKGLIFVALLPNHSLLNYLNKKEEYFPSELIPASLGQKQVEKRDVYIY